MPKGRKTCPRCSKGVAAASKRCQHCGQALQKRLQDNQGDSCGSPRHVTLIDLRTATLIRTPDARAHTAPIRRATGRSTRNRAGEDLLTFTDDNSSGDGVPGGATPDFTDQMQDEIQPEAVCPVSRIPLRWQGESPVQQYVRGLQLSQHRCVLAGDSTRGAYLYAVAGYDRSNTGDICIMVRTESPASLLVL